MERNHMTRSVPDTAGARPTLARMILRGVDRTGLATTIALLLKTDTPFAEARQSLSLRYIHLPFGRTGHLDHFLDLYERWLHEQGQEHTTGSAREWLLHGYRGDCCNGR